MVLEYLWTMGAKLRDSLRITAPSFLGDDEADLIAENVDVLPDRESRKQREQRIAIEQREKQSRAEEKDRDADETFLFLLVAEEYRRQVTEILHDIGDARTVVRLAYTQALQQEESARLALEEVQRNAIVLPDGRRVYFTRDNGLLYDEDNQQITDRGVIADALNRKRPDSASYEEFYERLCKDNEAAQRVEQIRNALATLDDIQTRVESGKLSAEELRQARADIDRVINELPQQFRDEYCRIRAARSAGQEPSYRAADPAFSSFPPVRADFFQAVHSPEEKLESKDPAPEKSDSRIPAYRSAPDF